MSEDTNPPLENAAGTPPASKQPRRPKFSEQQLATLTHEDLSKSWQELDVYIDFMEAQLSAMEGELAVAREAEERFRQQHLESVHREKVLVRRLATKEQETQEYVSQISELKAAQAPGAAALRSALLDPAVNLCLQRLAQQLAASRAKVEETQNELSAWKFTPDSNTGKRLMAKCRLLYQENEDLGRMVSSGRLAKLEGELALQKSFSEEVKKSQSELDEFLQELDEDVEGMQSTIYYLQQELRKSKETVASLQAEVSALRSGGTTALAPTSADVKQEKVELAEELVCKAESPPAQEAAADPVPLTVEDQDQPADEWKDVKPVPSVPSPSPTITIKTEPEDEDSSGSAELILKVEADELGPEAEFETEAVQEVQPVPECGEGKKRLFVNDDSSGDDSDNVPLIKKVRRDSELSLHYNEDEDEDEATRLINVNSAGQNNVQE